MYMSAELKLKVFEVVEDQLPLKEFEEWLYGREDLSDRMNEDIILELYSFNYNNRDARYEFKSTF